MPVLSHQSLSYRCCSPPSAAFVGWFMFLGLTGAVGASAVRYVWHAAPTASMTHFY